MPALDMCKLRRYLGAAGGIGERIAQAMLLWLEQTSSTPLKEFGLLDTDASCGSPLSKPRSGTAHR